jgi:hypothetical protein
MPANFSSNTQSFRHFSLKLFICHLQHSSLFERPRSYLRHRRNRRLYFIYPRIFEQFWLVGFERSVKFIGQDLFEEQLNFDLSITSLQESNLRKNYGNLLEDTYQ